MGPGLCRTIGRQLNEFMRLKAAPWRSIFQSEHIGATKLWQSCGKVGFGCLAKADPAAILFAATALERRLRSICLIFHSSPTYSPRLSSISTSSVMPCFAARCRTKVRAFSIANVGRSNLLNSSSMRPASTLERSRISLISESRWRPNDRMSSVYSDCFSLARQTFSRLRLQGNR
jgi:hypothetical protein